MEQNKLQIEFVIKQLLQRLNIVEDIENAEFNVKIEEWENLSMKTALSRIIENIPKEMTWDELNELVPLTQYITWIQTGIVNYKQMYTHQMQRWLNEIKKLYRSLYEDLLKENKIKKGIIIKYTNDIMEMNIVVISKLAILFGIFPFFYEWNDITTIYGHRLDIIRYNIIREILSTIVSPYNSWLWSKQRKEDERGLVTPLLLKWEKLRIDELNVDEYRENFKLKLDDNLFQLTLPKIGKEKPCKLFEKYEMKEAMEITPNSITFVMYPKYKSHRSYNIAIRFEIFEQSMEKLIVTNQRKRILLHYYLMETLGYEWFNNFECNIVKLYDWTRCSLMMNDFLEYLYKKTQIQEIKKVGEKIPWEEKIEYQITVLSKEDTNLFDFAKKYPNLFWNWNLIENMMVQLLCIHHQLEKLMKFTHYNLNIKSIRIREVDIDELNDRHFLGYQITKEDYVFLPVLKISTPEGLRFFLFKFFDFESSSISLFLPEPYPQAEEEHLDCGGNEMDVDENGNDDPHRKKKDFNPVIDFNILTLDLCEMLFRDCQSIVMQDKIIEFLKQSLGEPYKQYGLAERIGVVRKSLSYISVNKQPTEEEYKNHIVPGISSLTLPKKLFHSFPASQKYIEEFTTLKRLQFLVELKKKQYIIDRAHDMTLPAFRDLLEMGQRIYWNDINLFF